MTAARLLGEIAGFSALLFVARFVLRAHLLPQMDQECHIGGIAVDVLAHGVRFPLLVYAPNEYDNGSFFSGLLTAGSFSLLGRNVLALKLVTHVVSAIGAVAALWLLRACQEEVGLTTRRARFVATTALVIAFASAPRLVTLSSMYAVGNHAEGAAIDVILLALFSRSVGSRTRSAVHVAALWALVGFALYLNKGTLLVLPVLGAAEMLRAPRRIAAAAGGFVLGILPELLVIAQRHAMGWMVMAGKAEHDTHGFPRAFLDSLFTLADQRPELLVAWALALAAGVALFVHSTPGKGRTRDPGTAARSGGAVPITLGMVVGVACLHLMALTAMAQGGFDAYAIYCYPALAVLFALALGWICEHAAGRFGERVAAWSGVAAIALTLVLYRPDRLTWDTATISALWRNHAGAACSWRFAEGFEREHQYGLAGPAETREQHAIDRCRSLSEKDQVLDCIGGIARELNWRQNGKVPGEPPSTLTDDERRAYAYAYGTHRKGNSTPCRDFVESDLASTCASATVLECLVFGDALTRVASGRPIGRPRCPIREPPMAGYWSAMRSELLARPEGAAPERVTTSSPDTDLDGCGPVFEDCY